MKNYITLFKSQTPLTENHPVQKGVIKINEPLPAGDYEFGLYEKTSKKNTKYLSGTIREPFKKTEPQKEEPKPESSFNAGLDDNEDIPF